MTQEEEMRNRARFFIVFGELVPLLSILLLSDPRIVLPILLGGSMLGFLGAKELVSWQDWIQLIKTPHNASSPQVKEDAVYVLGCLWFLIIQYVVFWTGSTGHFVWLSMPRIVFQICSSSTYQFKNLDYFLVGAEILHYLQIVGSTTAQTETYDLWWCTVRLTLFLFALIKSHQHKIVSPPPSTSKPESKLEPELQPEPESIQQPVFPVSAQDKNGDNEHEFETIHSDEGQR